jgi:hypothetical protein
MPTLPITFDTLFSLYMDGIGTGVASLAMTLGHDAECAEGMANEIAAQIEGDPIAMEALKQQVRDRITGAHKPPPPPLKVFNGGTDQ